MIDLLVSNKKQNFYVKKASCGINHQVAVSGFAFMLKIVWSIYYPIDGDHETPWSLWGH